ncbi:hypothetical protein MOV08_36690 [Streptomyces yunnanensis]|uniref:Uncharacterized protein n=1 Tax=Streptomyces yunnanensis TaxID=156453 RepID=A0ABY8AGZ4_9ACTN|nr:hypothetical protein [Streptomyces yunnanensis]WEB44289.1 hypothetical protein MOV08_36690 [Streptomyces yunnanensis]
MVPTAGLWWALALTGPFACVLPWLDALDARALDQLTARKVPFGRRLVALLLDAVRACSASSAWSDDMRRP